MTKLEADPKLPLSTTLINQVTDKCFKRATSLSRAADLDDPSDWQTVPLEGYYLGGLLLWRALWERKSLLRIFPSPLPDAYM